MAEQYPVMPEAEPFFFEGNRIGVLVQHGFTGTTQSMRGIGEVFANQGYTVYGPRLAGHGTHYHVATLDHDADKISDECTDFIKRLSGE